MKEDLIKIRELLPQYVEIIQKEYPNSSADKVLERIQNQEELVVYNPSNAISFFVERGKLYLPKAAYAIFPILESCDGYGSNRGDHVFSGDYLKTDKTYFQYIEHLIKGAVSVYDYFEESLLHETMHLCGGGGSTPLEEGINELKTRELAMKYNIKIAGYAYPKEVEVAKQLQTILGKDVMDRFAFIPNEEKYDYLLQEIGEEKASLYRIISNKMIDISQGYNANLSSIKNPFEKAKVYDSIDYQEVYSMIQQYQNEEEKTIQQ